MVLGSPRSGTSLTTSIVHQLGFYADFGRADEFNEAGYWENAEAGRVNGMIMEYHGFDGFSCEPLPAGWENSKAMAHLDLNAKAVVQSLNCRGDWVVKNPQFCFTLPYWKKFLPSDTRYLVCVRSPTDAAMSINRQRGISPELGLETWYNSTTSALRNTEGLDRVVVFYEDYFKDSHQIEKISKFLDITTIGKHISVIQPKLNHSSGSTSELNVPLTIKMFYDSISSGNQLPNAEPIYHQPSTLSSMYYRARAGFVLRIGLDKATRLKSGFTSFFGGASSGLSKELPSS